MKYLMSIGGGVEQIKGIELAQLMGYKVVAIDGNKNAEGLKKADIGLYLDIKDESESIKIAKKYNIEGVIPSPIGRYLTTVGAINDALKLKGISRECAVKCTDKVIQNKLLSKNGVNCATQICKKNPEEILEGIKEIGYPCVLKPRFGAGSRGVKVILKEKDTTSLLEEHLNERGDDFSLIESLMQGQEYGVDAVIHNGIFNLMLVRKKRMTDLPYRQELEYLCPADLTEDQYSEIEKTLSDAVNALELDDCLIHADILMKNAKCSVIELSGRPSGYFLSQKVVPYVTGVDFLQQGVQIVTGNEVDLKIKKQNHMIISFLDFIGENYSGYITNEEIEQLPYVIESRVNIDNLGSVIKNGADIYNVGYVLVKGNDAEDVHNNLEMLKTYFYNKGKQQ